MKKELIDKIKVFLFKESNKILLGNPATEEQIEEAESQLNIKFSNDYIEFIKIFGGAYAGLDIHAMENGKALGKKTVVDMTKDLRASHPEVKNTYVVSDDGAGNPIMLDELGRVLIYYHDSGDSKILASSLGEYIEEVFVPW